MEMEEKSGIFGAEGKRGRRAGRMMDKAVDM
jgi:hypothetical protein